MTEAIVSDTSAGAGAVSLTAANGISLNSGNTSNVGRFTIDAGTATYAQSGNVLTQGVVLITAADLDLSGAINANAGTAAVTFTPTAGRVIDLGSNTPGTFGVTAAEFNFITAGSINIGNKDSGSIDISGSVVLSDTNLKLTTANSIAFGAGGALDVGTGRVTLLATSGSIDGDADDLTNVTAGSLVASAKNGIGTTHALETNLPTTPDSPAAVLTNTLSGDLGLVNEGELWVTAIQRGGAITDANAPADSTINVTTHDDTVNPPMTYVHFVAPESVQGVAYGDLFFGAQAGEDFSKVGTSYTLTNKVVSVGFNVPNANDFQTLVRLDGITTIDDALGIFSFYGNVTDTTGRILMRDVNVDDNSIADLINETGFVVAAPGSVLPGNTFDVSQFQVVSLNFTPDSFRLFDGVGGGEVHAYGSLALPIGTTAVSVRADDSDNYVTLTPADAQPPSLHLSASLNDTLSIGGIDFDADLTLEYDASTGQDVFTASGSAGVSITGLGSLNLVFGDDGLVITDGEVTRNEAELDPAFDFSVDSVQITPVNLSLNYSTEAGSTTYTVGGSARVNVDGLGNATVTLADTVIQDNELKSMKLSVANNTSISGATITGVSNQVNPTITTSTPVTLALGQTVTIAGVNGATGVNGTFSVKELVDSQNFKIENNIAPGVFTANDDTATFEAAINDVTNTVDPTITTSIPVTLAVGQVVTISGVLGATGANGMFVVKSVDPTDPKKFQITLPQAPGQFNFALATGKIAYSTTITGVTDSQTSEITLSTAVTLVPGQTVTISGVEGATGVNGTFTVDSVNPTDPKKFQIALPKAPAHTLPTPATAAK